MAAQAFQAISSIDDFDRRLPWPLSSILRAYKVETELRLKTDRLNYFLRQLLSFFAISAAQFDMEQSGFEESIWRSPKREKEIDGSIDSYVRTWGRGKPYLGHFKSF